MITLNKVKTKTKDFRKYRKFLSKSGVSRIRLLTKSLSNRRIIHINATAVGGGVAEILQSFIPLLKNLGLDIDWYTISAPPSFFEITKQIHNGLQGKKSKLKKKDLKFYLSVNQKLAEKLRNIKFDLAVIHDPQPLAMIDFWHPSFMISRIHIDLSTPDKQLLAFFLPYLNKYEKIVFSLKEFIPKKISKDKVVIIPPAIDPFTIKNQAYSFKKARKILASLGLDPKRPIIAQVSRFDPWKDPIGVIRAYQLAKKKIPDLQLILIGLFLAADDPEAVQIFEQVKQKAQGDPDIFLFSDPRKLKGLTNDEAVNAIQSGSDIILQKSIREGFGLVVTEAMWKGKAVIGGNAAGIKFQIKDGQNGFIVKSPQETAKRIINLFANSDKLSKIGKKAKESVQRHFLITRLIRDHLELYRQVLGQ